MINMRGMNGNVRKVAYSKDGGATWSKPVEDPALVEPDFGAGRHHALATHFLFFAIEAVLRKPLNIRHREIAQQVGLVLLICLMAFAFYNDINRLFTG